MGSGAAGVFGLRARDEVEELERETDLRELYDAFRGGNGGAVFWLLGGDASKWMRGGELAVDWRTIVSDTCLLRPFTGGFVTVGLLWRGA